MNYADQTGYQYNNQYPWKIDNSEIAFVLAENGIRRNANTMPIKCWIPTIMGPKQIRRPVILTGPLSNSIYINDTKCKPPVSPTIQTQNYVSVQGAANRYYAHRWLDHGTIIWVHFINQDIDDIEIDTTEDNSYCDSCIAEHPGCNTVHGCGA